MVTKGQFVDFELIGSVSEEQLTIEVLKLKHFVYVSVYSDIIVKVSNTYLMAQSFQSC